MSLIDSLRLDLSRGACLLVASRRHLRRLRQDYDEAMLAGGTHCWPTANILTVEAWLQQLHQALLATGAGRDRLLSELEAIALWESLAPENLALLQTALHQAARGARQSYLALKVHHGRLEQVAGMELNADQRQFLDWAARVEARLDHSRLVDPGSLALYLCQHVDRLGPAGKLLLHRLPKATPALAGLLASLEQAGWKVASTLDPSTPVRPSFHQASDGAAERSTWLAWARERLAQDPGARLAVITPELGDARASIERDLLSVLQPELETPGHTDRERVFDLPGGESLCSFGVIETLLDVLRVCTSRSIEWPILSRLLRSRYLDLEDHGVLASFEAELRTRCRPTFSARWLVDESEQRGLTQLAGALSGANAQLMSTHRRSTMDAWIEAFSACLELWRWPGRESLGSDEYQAVEAAGTALRRLAAAADLLGPLASDAATGLLCRHLEAPFQPERGTPRLWLFDRYVDPGMDLDGLWVAGLSASRWPEAIALDPLLPIALQRTLKLPGTDAEERIGEARSLLDCWARSASELVISWPAVEDEAAQSPSPLVGSAPDHAPAPPSPSRSQQLFGTGSLEPVPPTPVRRLSGAIRGGSKLLEWQSACPFRAFAQLRVAAQQREEPAEGVNHALRGSILHAALKRFWDETRDRQTLLSMTPEGRLQRAHSCVREALERHAGQRLGPRGRAVEATWQLAALQQAIETDLQRRDFVVAGTEQRHTVELAGLQIGCSVDRIDRVDGQLLVIDYKTSKNLRTGSWVGHRPESPQLPLYASAAVPDAAAIAFFQVQSSSARLFGVGCELEDGISAPTPPHAGPDEERSALWQQQQRDWSRELAGLATALAAGAAEVDPRAEEDCRHCHLGPACRVHWLSGDGEEWEAAE